VREASKVFLDPLDLRETSVCQDPLDLLESRVFRDPPDPLESWDPQDPTEFPDKMDRPASLEIVVKSVFLAVLDSLDLSV